jgi:hypothetical protein
MDGSQNGGGGDDDGAVKDQWREAWEHREAEDKARQAQRLLELKTQRADLHLQVKALEEELAELEGRGDWTSMVRPLAKLGWLDRPAPARRILLERDGECVLPLGKVGFFVGEGGIGKSWALTQLAISVATGTPWFQNFSVPAGSKGAVFMAMGEEDPEEMHRRLFDVSQHLDLADHHLADLEQLLWPLPLAGHFVEFLSDGDRSFQHERFEQQLRQNAPPEGWRLIVLDPASRFMGIDAEKDNAFATRFVQLLERLTELPGQPTVLCAHHTTKAARASQSGGSRSVAARGASALTDGARWQGNLAQVFEDGELVPNMAVFNVTKSNYGPRPPQLYLRRKPGSGVLIPSDPPGAQTAASSMFGNDDFSF